MVERQNQRWVVGISGASGMKYALRLLNVLSLEVAEVHVVFSEPALRVLGEEEGISLSFARLNARALLGEERPNIYFYNPRDIGAAIASGSTLFDGMVVVPCSMGTLGAIAHGVSQNLLHRAADVTLKERRRLVLVPRETPLSEVHLRNMLLLAKMGVAIVPAMPGFYHQPASLADLVDMMVMKILDQMGVPNNLVKRWGEGNERLASPVPMLVPVTKS